MIRFSYILFLLISIIPDANAQRKNFKSDFEKIIVKTLEGKILKDAAWALKQKPVTITAYRAARSAGGIHDFIRKAIIGGQIR